MTIDLQTVSVASLFLRMATMFTAGIENLANFVCCQKCQNKQSKFKNTNAHEAPAEAMDTMLSLPPLHSTVRNKTTPGVE